MLKNIFIGGITQIIIIALHFISRSIFIRYVGIEILGISSAMASLVSTLSLAELGVQTAVVYRLYKPMAEKNYDACNEIVTAYKRIYEIIAAGVALLMFVLSPFIGVFLKGVKVSRFVYIIYILFCCNTIVSYLLAYKRTILYVDQKDSVSKSVDSICNIIFTSVGIWIVLQTKNYVLYLCLQLFQTIISNLILHIICNKRYVWQHYGKVNKNVIKNIFGDVKNIFVNRIAIFIYNATDNLIISSVISAVAVGYYSNYIMITGSIRNVISVALGQITPFLGKNYALNDDRKATEQIFMACTFVNFLFAGIIIVPLLILTHGFIAWWLGEAYILQGILVFLCIDIYIHFLHSPVCDYLAISGSFVYERNCSIVGASLNFVASLIFVQLCGMQGVVIGTVLSQMCFWILRGYAVIKKVFHSERNFIFQYIIKNSVYALSLVGIAFLMRLICSLFTCSIYIFDFLLKGAISVLGFAIVSVLLFFRTKEFAFVFEKLQKRLYR